MTETQLGNVRLQSPEAEMLEALLLEYESRSELIRAAIRVLHARKYPPIIFGYVRLDRLGDLAVRDDGEGDECPECGQDLWEPYLWFASDGSLGVVCSGCATSE